MKNSVTRDAFLAIAAVIAALVPFLNKAFHIDDPLFLWMAQQVSQHPADPYGFSVNWYLSAKPMFSIMQNPPLNAYYIALAASSPAVACFPLCFMSPSLNHGRSLLAESQSSSPFSHYSISGSRAELFRRLTSSR